MSASRVNPEEFFAAMDEADARARVAGPAANDAAVELTPPHDLDAEAAVLSAVLLDRDALAKIPALRASDFYAEAHRRVFEACLDLGAAGGPVDVVQVATWLRERGRLPQVGGMAYLTEVLNAAPAVTNVASYAATVISKSRARQAVELLSRARAEVLSTGDTSRALACTSAVAELAAPDAGADLLDAAALAAPLPEIEHLVREVGLVAGAGAPHMFAGFGFTGKTVAAQALALSLAAGAVVWGAYRGRSARVLHVDLEQGDRLTRRRYQRLAAAAGIKLAALGDALAVAVMPRIRLVPDDAARWRALMAGRDLIVIDSFRAATGGQDENSSDIRAGLDMLGSVSEATGCRALVIHHARKPSENDMGDARFAIRGSGAIFDACDSVYVFSAKKGEPTRVENPKARSHGETVEDFALVVSDLELDGDTRAGLRVQVHGAELVAQRREEHASSQRQARARADAQTIRAIIGGRPGIGSRDLRAAAKGQGGLGAERVAEALSVLADAVDVRDEVVGRTRVARHFLRGTP